MAVAISLKIVVVDPFGVTRIESAAFRVVGFGEVPHSILLRLQVPFHVYEVVLGDVDLGRKSKRGLNVVNGPLLKTTHIISLKPFF